MFLAGSPGVMLATYVSGNVSGEEGEVWSSDRAGCALEFGNSAKDPLKLTKYNFKYIITLSLLKMTF